MSKMQKKWLKAQALEPIHWLDNKEKISSDDYQSTINLRAKHIFHNISSKLKITTDNKAILEIGGGATPLAIYAKNSDITLVDPLMNFYEEEFRSVFPSNCKKIESKAEMLPFDDDSFDIILTRNALDHVEDVHACMSEMKRVLKPGGVAYIGMNVFAGPLLVYKTINKDPEHPYTFSKKSFKNLIDRYFVTKYEIDDDPINGDHFVENEDKIWYKNLLRSFFLNAGNYKIVELYTIKE